MFKDPEKYVEQLLELFNRFTKLVENAFNGYPRFMTSRDKVLLLFRLISFILEQQKLNILRHLKQ
jgi:hypothetical protein